MKCSYWHLEPWSWAGGLSAIWVASFKGDACPGWMGEQVKHQEWGIWFGRKPLPRRQLPEGSRTGLWASRKVLGQGQGLGGAERFVCVTCGGRERLRFLAQVLPCFSSSLQVSLLDSKKILNLGIFLKQFKR